MLTKFEDSFAGAPDWSNNTVNQKSTKTKKRIAIAFSGLMMLASISATGCQMHIAGQTLPSGYWLQDDVQYFAPGPEFKLAREAAALKEQSANQISEPQY